MLSSYSEFLSDCWKGCHIAMATNSDLNNKKNAVNVGEMIARNKQKKSLSNYIEKAIPTILFIIAFISVLTTIGIVFTLIIGSN